MKQLIINAVLCLLCLNVVNAQSGVKVTSGSQIVCEGNPHIVLNDMSWDNEGSFKASNSFLHFTGTKEGTATIADASFNTYHHLSVNRLNDALRLDSDIDLEGNYYFLDGLLNLNNQTLTFLNEEGYMMNENENAHAVGPVGGQAIAGKLLTFPEKENVGNLGAIITAGGDLSYTEIRRGHGLYFTPGGHSISRWYIINSAMGMNVPTSIRFHYLEHELNGLNENHLQVWNSNDYGLSWNMVEVVNRNTHENWVEIFGEGINGLFTISNPAGDFSPEGDAYATTPEVEIGKLNAYPNPLVDQLQVVLEVEKEGNLQLQWLDAMGRIIKMADVNALSGKNIYSFDLSTFAAGTYFLTIVGEAYLPIRIVKM